MLLSEHIHFKTSKNNESIIDIVGLCPAPTTLMSFCSTWNRNKYACPSQLEDLRLDRRCAAAEARDCFSACVSPGLHLFQRTSHVLDLSYLLAAYLVHLSVSNAVTAQWEIPELRQSNQLLGRNHVFGSG